MPPQAGIAGALRRLAACVISMTCPPMGGKDAPAGSGADASSPWPTAERGRLRCGGQVRRASGLIVVDDDGVAVFTRNGENMTACSGTTSPMIDPVLVWGESMVDAP